MRSSHELKARRLSPWWVLLVLVLLRGGLLHADQGRRTIVDGVGRTLQVPAHIRRVYATSPVAEEMIYSLAPQMMVGWNYRLDRAERHFILPSVRNLPVLGGWFGENGKGNRETLIASRPDVILSIGYSDRTSIDFADRLQRQVGIPVFVASARLVDTAATYERLGRLLGVPGRAKLLADYSRRALAEAQGLAASVPPGERPRIYYAEGLRGLQTDTKGSLHTELLDFLGLENVAQGPKTSGFGRASVSLDQVITWAPDVILACPEKVNPDGSWTPDWLGDPTWGEVQAVKTGRVYLIPGAPFNWFDRPPSIARLLGAKWLLWVLYPRRVGFDMAAETREFYRLFFWYDMGKNEARKLLTATEPKLAPTSP